MSEVCATFAFNPHRERLFRGFRSVVSVLESAGCRAIYLDGSFVSDKVWPQDYDGCWDPTGVNLRKLDPVLLDYTNNRAAQKLKYLGEMFIATISEASGRTFLDFFQTERNTGRKKGIILVEAAIGKVGR